MSRPRVVAKLVRPIDAPHPLVRLPFPLDAAEPAPQSVPPPHRYRAIVRALAALVVADLTDPEDV
jgi:hypothetical protein